MTAIRITDDQRHYLVLADSPLVLDLAHGPAQLIHNTRDAENSDSEGQRWPRGKGYDDATAVYWRTDMI